MKMTDRELLELAAKAAGYSVRTDLTYEGVIVINDGVFWNPLTNDGAALRLAVKLGLAIHVWSDETTVMNCQDEAEVKVVEGCADPYAATRRAIVRAAAAIGEQMK